MKAFTDREARQNLAKLLMLAQTEEIEIRCKDGSVFGLRAKTRSGSPFDIPSVTSNMNLEEVVHAVKISRRR